jgi:hypothetical protein
MSAVPSSMQVQWVQCIQYECSMSAVPSSMHDASPRWNPMKEMTAAVRTVE